MELKKGDRIEMIFMANDPVSGKPDPHPIEPGTQGEVVHINTLWKKETQVSVAWDNGRTLAVLLPYDQIKKL